MILGLIFIRGGGGLLFGWLIFGRNFYKMFWFGLGRDVSEKFLARIPGGEHGTHNNIYGL